MSVNGLYGGSFSKVLKKKQKNSTKPDKKCKKVKKKLNAKLRYCKSGSKYILEHLSDLLNVV
jgi:hypothetical protein